MQELCGLVCRTFVDILNDGTKREQLKQLKPEHAHTDPNFQHLRNLSDTFQAAAR